jgi:uncharacterized protein YcfJ
MEPTIKNLEPLIKKEINQGASYIVHFQASNQINPIQGYAPNIPDKNQIMKNVTKQTTKTVVKTSIISMLSRFLGGLIGGRIGREVGYVASSVATATASNPMSANDIMTNKIDDKKRQELIITAFKTVQNYFEWNEETQQWDGKPEN